MKFSFNKVSGFRLLITMCVSLMMASSIFGQTGTSSVTGTIRDAQGNVIPGASVKLLGGQGGERTATSNSSGVYSFAAVPPGSYRVEVEASGFKKAAVTAFQALVDSAAVVNVQLEVGQVSETVNVEASGIEGIVNTQDASLGNNFVSQQILQLPLNARNVSNLLSLQAGVTPDGSVMGGRSDQSNITLDGVDVNNQQQGTAFSPVIRVNPDSVEEFRVTTSNPDATKGRSSGAQISLITKSGTNEFHGAVYNYHRNTVTSANSWFSNAAGRYDALDDAVINGASNIGDMRAPRGQLIRNLFGGRLGGPIVKDKLFFFYNYEGLREARQTAVTRLVPLAHLGQGLIRFRDAGCSAAACGTARPAQSWELNVAQINALTLTSGTVTNPVVNVNPLVTTLLANAASKYQANMTSPGDGINTGGYRFNAPTPSEQNAHTLRLDWNLTNDQTHQVSVRGNYQQDTTGNAPYFPDTPPTNTWSHPLGVQASHTWLVNNNVTNRFTFGLTRMAYTDQGDSTDPALSFRFVFQPNGFSRGFSRVNPTYNFTDDVTWITGNHNIQFGTNIRLIRNLRTNYARAFDYGSSNPSGYPSNQARQALDQYIRVASGDPAGSNRQVSSSMSTTVQGALVAMFGRLNGYGANINYNVDGSLQQGGTPLVREFKTEEYDFYVQDAWKLRPNITMTLGLRYGLSMPVYETQGFETAPSTLLSEYLDRRREYAYRGLNYDEPISVRLAGKANGLDSMYPLDKNNWQPRLALAWSPEFKTGFWSKIFGVGSESVIRGGFAITNDYFGQQLATQWDGGNTLGFSSTSDINVNTYSIVDGPNAAPLYTGPNMNIRGLPNMNIPPALTFPQTAPYAGPGGGKIEGSLDQDLVSPVNYSWNISYGRKLPGKIWIDAAYVGRLARNLMLSRDVMMVNDPRDPISGMTFNQAATIIEQHLRAGTPIGNIPNIPYFDNMWGAGNITDTFCSGGTGSCPTTYTNTQAVAWLRPNETGDWGYMWAYLSNFGLPNYFFQGQYDALSAHGTVGSSDYHGGTLSVRQRFTGVTWDLNYTYAKSIDDASGLQTSGAFGGGSFVIDAFNIRANRAVSDFDIRHVVNFNGIWDVPIGRNKFIGGGMNKVLDAVIGGWQLSGVVRYDSGQNQGASGHYEDGSGWQTNWNRRSYPVLVTGIQTGTNFGTASAACTPSRTVNCSLPNMYSDPDTAWNSFRTPFPGETGTRNALWLPHFFNIDAGLSKSFNMPWKEGHKASIRWDVFNVMNTPVFSGQALTLVGETGGNPNSPYFGSAAGATFGQYTGSRNPARVMQFAFRYDF